MFRGITWAEYGVAVILLSGLYYSYIGWRYYRLELVQMIQSGTFFFRQRTEKLIPAVEVDPVSSSIPTPSAPANDTSVDEVDAFISRIQLELSLAAAHEYDKQTILERIALAIGEHPEVNVPALRSSLNEIIMKTLEQQGTVNLSVTELNQIWEEV